MVIISIFPVGPKEILHFRFQVAGRRIQRSTRLSKAQRREARELAEQALAVAVLRSQGKEPVPTVAALVQQWTLAHALRVSPAHVEAVERFGRLHLGPLADLLLTDCSTRQVEAALNLFLAAGHAPASGNQWLAYLHLLMGWAIRSKMIKELPYEVGRLKVQRRPKVILSAVKASKWFAQVERQNHAHPGVILAIYLMAGLGLRKVEAQTARWQWLDLDRAVYAPGQTKGREARERPVPEWLLDRLRPLARPDGLIAHAEDGGKLSFSRIDRAIFSANEACGTHGLTAHRLRASYATELSAAGLPIQDIQWILGHADIRTTAIYLGVDLSRVRAAQARMAERWNLAGRRSGERSRGKRTEPRCEQ